MDLDNKKILVTGGAGFIGSNFVHMLFREFKGVDVRVLDKLTYSGNLNNLKELRGNGNFKFIEGDICDEMIVEKAMREVDIVINFAAEAAVDRSIDDSQSFLKTDIFGVYVLLNQAKKQGAIHKFVQISTDEVYGEIREGSFTEKSELKPRNPYSASKLGGDRLAYSFFVTYGLPVVITRASNNYGPMAYLEKAIPLFITNLIDGQKIPVYGQGLQIRDWLHVEDHCRAIAFLMDKGVPGEVYNIAGSQECTNIQLARAILRLMGKDESFIEFVRDRPGHDFRYSLDSSKLRKLGWVPRYDLTTGLKETVQWYRDNEHWWRPVKKKLDRRYVTGFWGAKT